MTSQSQSGPTGTVVVVELVVVELLVVVVELVVVVVELVVVELVVVVDTVVVVVGTAIQEPPGQSASTEQGKPALAPPTHTPEPPPALSSHPRVPRPTHRAKAHTARLRIQVVILNLSFSRRPRPHGTAATIMEHAPPKNRGESLSTSDV